MGSNVQPFESGYDLGGGGSCASADDGPPVAIAAATMPAASFPEVISLSLERVRSLLPARAHLYRA
jgi:hypothetical protein